MDREYQAVEVIIVEAHTCRWGVLNDDTALTLIAVTSEDPSDWDDMVACWDRYRSPLVEEFAANLPLAEKNLHEVLALLDPHAAWVVIDLEQKRVLMGQQYQPVQRDDTFNLVTDDEEGQRWSLSIHLPPWWELCVDADVAQVERPREAPLSVPRTDRELLYGDALHQDLTTRMLDIVESPEWKTSGAADDESRRYPFTVRVHREWLMTPRDDLDGRSPRDLLHGGREWIDRIIWGQQLRCQDVGETVALPTDFTNFDQAPLGTEEIATYFDLCRTLIEMGWVWCVHAGAAVPNPKLRPRRQSDLAELLALVQNEWMDAPFEGGSPPRFIIEANRRRVPRAVGAPIAGMDGNESAEHAFDCDCPICIMMAEEGAEQGPTFVGIDGHHLELDGEFAFSLCATREEWEEEQRGFGPAGSTTRGESETAPTDAEEPDPFAPVWSGVVSDEPLPGDSQGHMGLAFMMAEIVGLLQTAGAETSEIKELNERFVEFRHERPTLTTATVLLTEYLEELSERYPQLVSRAADLQSRLYERLYAADESEGAP